MPKECFFHEETEWYWEGTGSSRQFRCARSKGCWASMQDARGAKHHRSGRIKSFPCITEPGYKPRLPHGTRYVDEPPFKQARLGHAGGSAIRPQVACVQPECALGNSQGQDHHPDRIDGVAEYVVEEKGEQEQVQHDQEHEEPPSGYAYDADHQHFGGDELPQLGEVDPGVGDDQVPDGWVDGSNDAVEIDGMIDEQADGENFVCREDLQANEDSVQPVHEDDVQEDEGDVSLEDVPEDSDNISMIMPQGIPRIAEEPQHGVLHQRMCQLAKGASLANHGQGVDMGEDEVHGGDGGEELKGWAGARNKRVLPRFRNSQAVRDYAYEELSKLATKTKSRECAEQDLKDTARRHAHVGKPDPEGFDNCYPNSIYACEKVLDVPELNRYLIHVCTTPRCIHFWLYMANAAHHYRTCENLECPDCKCPHCGSSRFVKGQQGVVGAQSCWLFIDAIQSLFLQPDFSTAVLASQALRDSEGGNGFTGKPSFAMSSEYGRLCTVLPQEGYDMSKVFFFDLGFDGVQLLNNYTVNFLVIRSRDAAPNISSKAENAATFMIIPGPRDPKCGWDVFNAIYLEAFVALGIHSDLDEKYRRVYVPPRFIPPGPFRPVDPPAQASQPATPAQGDDSDEDDPLPAPVPLEGIPMQPVLCGLVGDFPARSHLTNWIGQSGRHPGGWCMECLDQETQPAILGFTRDVNQPFLKHRSHNTWGAAGLERRLAAMRGDDPPAMQGRARTHAPICDPLNMLSDVELEQIGEFVHQVAAARAAAKKKEAGKGRDNSKLRSLGYRNLKETEDLFKELGRNGRLPWASPYFKRWLGYIQATTFVQLPPAHLLLHGLVSALWKLAMGKESGWQHKDNKDCPFLMSKEQLKLFKDDWEATKFPHCKGSGMPDPAKLISSFKMEELALLLSLGGIAAKHASEEFRDAWKCLRTAAEHYLYDFNSSPHQATFAFNELFEYGRLIECQVVNGKAPAKLLSPNLLVGVCQLPRQEKARHKIAYECEWWLERFFLLPKMFVAILGRVRPEVTYMKKCILLARSLDLHRALFPHVDATESPHKQGLDPNVALGVHPFMVGAGILYSHTVHKLTLSGKSARTHVTCDEVADLCLQSLASHEVEEPASEHWKMVRDAVRDGKDTDVLKYVDVYVFKKCRFDYFLCSSKLAQELLASPGKSEASSFCIVRNGAGTGQVYPACIRFFVMMKWRHNPDIFERFALAWKFPVDTDATECQAFGRQVYRVDVGTELDDKNLSMILVSNILRPVFVIKVPDGSNRAMWRWCSSRVDYWEVWKRATLRLLIAIRTSVRVAIAYPQINAAPQCNSHIASFVLCAPAPRRTCRPARLPVRVIQGGALLFHWYRDAIVGVCCGVIHAWCAGSMHVQRPGRHVVGCSW